ncbi:hypothetical protein BLOT_013284 [Blomia tropicalis]|nr:hypothetical protein BLOT_013284 [Blomia tropicalis]
MNGRVDRESHILYCHLCSIGVDANRLKSAACENGSCERQALAQCEYVSSFDACLVYILSI